MSFEMLGLHRLGCSVLGLLLRPSGGRVSLEFPLRSCILFDWELWGALARPPGELRWASGCSATSKAIVWTLWCSVRGLWPISGLQLYGGAIRS